MDGMGGGGKLTYPRKTGNNEIYASSFPNPSPSAYSTNVKVTGFRPGCGAYAPGMMLLTSSQLFLSLMIKSQLRIDLDIAIS